MISLEWNLVCSNSLTLLKFWHQKEFLLRMLSFPAKTFESDWPFTKKLQTKWRPFLIIICSIFIQSSDWLMRFLIIICSIFIQSSDWLMWFLIIICSIFVQSSDWLMWFLIIICSIFCQNLMSKIEWVKEILQSKIYNGEIHENLKHP